jgi:hypothetical protein
VIEIGSRRRAQPAPPHVVFEALAEPDRDPARPWLYLLADEQRPTVLSAEPPARLTWSSLWIKRPDLVVQFELPRRSDGGTDLRWTLFADEPAPGDALTGHLRKRLNQLINANLRYTFGQRRARQPVVVRRRSRPSRPRRPRCGPAPPGTARTGSCRR